MFWSPLNKRLALACILAVMLVAMITTASTASTTSPDTKRQSELAVLLEQDCGSCHGLTRKGGLGSALLPDSIAHFTDDALVDIILDGVPGTPMPPWRRFLNRAEASWIVERLRQGAN
jgi:cytochrome c55X